ncbi:MAG: alpha/beta hydrolase [Spirulinaceae cyanobacterium SM2_1_0]|nr:alpha/beta hydrolase [Spirulinaceae cyanobacterium SM2_1_0]
MAFLGRSHGQKQGNALSRWLRLTGLSLLGAGSSLLLAAETSRAAEELILTYGPVQQTVEIDNLAEFAATGEQSSEIAYLLRVSGQDPETVRNLLNYELTVDFLLLNRVLNSLPGEYLLYEFGQVLHTKSRRANIQSLRAAVLLPLSEDNQVTPLEFFQNYPTQQVYLDGVELVAVIQRFSGLIENLRADLAGPLAIVEDFLGGLVCECEAPGSTEAP